MKFPNRRYIFICIIQSQAHCKGPRQNTRSSHAYQRSRHRPTALIPRRGVGATPVRGEAAGGHAASRCQAGSLGCMRRCGRRPKLPIFINMGLLIDTGNNAQGLRLHFQRKCLPSPFLSFLHNLPLGGDVFPMTEICLPDNCLEHYVVGEVFPGDLNLNVRLPVWE